MHKTAIPLLSIALALSACKKDKEPEATPDRPAPEPTRPAPAAGGLDAAAIGKAAEATTTADGVVRIGWGRTDVPVEIDGAPFPPAAGLGSWAAFAAVEGGAMVMGDTVVFQDEITAAIDAAFAAGLQVTALHNHFVFDDPPVFFMHIGGKGDPVKLAGGVKSMWDAIKAVRSAAKTPARAFDDSKVVPGKLDAKALGSVIGTGGSDKLGGVVKFVIERRATMHGLEFGGSMGLTTWAAFAGDDKLASIDGDFAMTAAEVQPARQQDPRRRPPQPHDRRDPRLLLRPLLGQGRRLRPRPRLPRRPRRPGKGGHRVGYGQSHRRRGPAAASGMSKPL
jgi:hypothetical protein